MVHEVNVEVHCFCLRENLLRTQQRNVIDSNVVSIADLITESVYIKVPNMTILSGE
jgi:hypothetical protein